MSSFSYCGNNIEESDFILHEGLFFYMFNYEGKKYLTLPQMPPDVMFYCDVDEKYKGVDNIEKQLNYQHATFISNALLDKNGTRPYTDTEKLFLDMSMEEREEYIGKITDPNTYTELILPKSVTIGKETIPLFSVLGVNSKIYGYVNLQRIHIPSSVQFFGMRIRYCENLEEITVEDGNPSLLSYNGALYDKKECKLLAAPKKHTGKYEVPEGTQTIGYAAFSGCNYEEIVLPKTLKIIEQEVFSQCRNLKQMILPDNVEQCGSSNWEYGVFHGCESLELVDFGNVEYIGFQACKECKSLSKVVAKSAKRIGSIAFWGCPSIQEFDVPQLESIEYMLMWNNIPDFLRNKGNEKLLGKWEKLLNEDIAKYKEKEKEEERKREEEDRRYQLSELKNLYECAGFTIHLKTTRKYPEIKSPVITIGDMMDYQYIIRDKNDNEILVKYNSLEEIVNDGWRLD